jgi:hypothetical protein
MAGLLDLLGGPANTGNNGTGFSPAFAGAGSSAQQAAPPPSLMPLMQQLWAAKSTPAAYDEPNDFVNSPYRPSPEQAARMAQLGQIFPHSRNVVDRTQPGVLEAYPQQPLPVQQMNQGLWGAMMQNPTWPLRGGSVFRF